MIDSLAQIVFLSKPTLKVRFNIQTHLFWSREVTFVAIDKLCGFILVSTILWEDQLKAKRQASIIIDYFLGKITLYHLKLYPRLYFTP